MFHCNGWCFPWTVAALAGTNVCLRRVEAEAIFDAFARHGVTHFCGAPIVLNMIANAPRPRSMERRIEAMTAGAAPPAAVIEAMESQGFDVTHVYGLTETYGPAVVSAWHSEWNDRPVADRARAQGAPRRALRRARGADGRRPGVPGAGAEGRRNDGRDPFSRQQRHEGLPQEPGRDRRSLRRRLVPFGRPSASGTRTATSKSRTDPRTSSFPAARTSRRSRSRVSSTATRRFSRRRSRRAPTANGARARAPSSP